MTAPAVPRSKLLRKSRSSLLALALLVLLVAGMGTFVSYVLWPTWPKAAAPLDAPAVPVTVAGVLFNVPPASIRAAVQRHPGAHERIDLVFLWPSLAPPAPGGEASATKTVAERRRRRSHIHKRSSLRDDCRPRRGDRACGAAAHHLSALYRDAGDGRPGRARHRPRSEPARPMRARTSSISRTNPSSSSPAARGRSARCLAPASTSVRSMPPRSRCGSRANGCRIGATSPPDSTGSSRSFTHREGDASRYSRSLPRIAIWKL